MFGGRLQEAETSFTLAIEVLERFLIANAKTTNSTSTSAHNAPPDHASDSDNGDVNNDNREKGQNGFIGLENIRDPNGNAPSTLPPIVLAATPILSFS